jgi:hypothetical protein
MIKGRQIVVCWCDSEDDCPALELAAVLYTQDFEWTAQVYDFYIVRLLRFENIFRSISELWWKLQTSFCIQKMSNLL